MKLLIVVLTVVIGTGGVFPAKAETISGQVGIFRFITEMPAGWKAGIEAEKKANEILESEAVKPKASFAAMFGSKGPIIYATWSVFPEGFAVTAANIVGGVSESSFPSEWKMVPSELKLDTKMLPNRTEYAYVRVLGTGNGKQFGGAAGIKTVAIWIDIPVAYQDGDKVSGGMASLYLRRADSDFKGSSENAEAEKVLMAIAESLKPFAAEIVPLDTVTTKSGTARKGTSDPEIVKRGDINNNEKNYSDNNRQQRKDQRGNVDEGSRRGEQQAALDRERQELAEEHRRLEEQKRQREQAKAGSRIKLQVSTTSPSKDGEYTISIQTNSDTASLKINGDELGGKADGRYTINRVARVGQDTKLDIIARDVYGNTDFKTIIVSRAVVDSKVVYAALDPSKIKRQFERDAVAIIIGVSDYRNLPKAAHADDDARAFYDYAIRALGVKPENIKLLINHDAGEIEIYKTFKNWLPGKVRATTDVFVFYSGHGYTAANGKGLYWFPIQGDSQLISKTAILVEELNSDILAAKPKSVTIFADACYSGQARSGETLIADARPVFPKVEARLFPESFTVITASQYDQISSSSPDLKHGIFSYYLMKGMEGDADANKDGRITLGEMQAYLVENVGRQAGMMSRKQEPQLIGDGSKVLVGHY